MKTRLTYEKQLKGWILGEKNELQSDSNFYYSFVDLGLVESKVYVVPSKKVSAILKESHSKWLKTKGKNGESRNDRNIRKLKLDYTDNPLNSAKGLWIEKYAENWSVLEK